MYQTSRAGSALILARRISTTSFRGLAAAAALFALLGSAGCIGLTGSSLLGPAAGGDISVTPSPLKFGNVVVGTTDSYPMTLSNTGKVDLTISSVAISGKGFSVSGISTPLTLGAGQSADFTSSFKPAAAGSTSGQISIASNAAKFSVGLSGAGIASAPQLSASTSTLSFGSVTVGTPSSLPVALKNTGNADLDISKVSASGTGFAVSGGSGVTLTPDQSVTVTVTFEPKGTGTVTGGLTIASNATNSTAIKLSGAGVAAPAVKHSVALNWSPSTSTVIGYFVYRSTISGGPYSKLTSSVDTVPSYTDGTVSGGLTYYYVVTSVDSSNVESAYSNQVSVTIPSP
jgi:Abnormal spindle-like microcephaly-assoc'd, ASPM-SPD-2-Hydin